MQRILRTQPFDSRHVLVTGASGYVGGLVVASLLRDSAARISCLLRGHHELAAVLAPIVDEWQLQSGSRWSAAVQARLNFITLPQDIADLPDLAPSLAGVDEVVHAAGCVDYHDTARLRQANVLYTLHLIALARRLKPQRFIVISSAYAGGYRDTSLPEAALDEPARDPTPYTRSKREAERLVAASGLPWLILRPSILIGDSRSGRYTGQRYGLVQQWASLDQLLGDRHHADLHVPSGDAQPNLLHQDAFCAAFKAARRWLPDRVHCNLVADAAGLPSLRDLWLLWCEHQRPERLHLYPSTADIPLRSIDIRQRTYLSFARINLQIAAHRWRHDTGWLDLLRAQGLQLPATTLDSVRRCQDWYAAGASLRAVAGPATQITRCIEKAPAAAARAA